MDLEEFALAATMSDLSQEPKGREHADFVEFQMGAADSPLVQLSEYTGELPLIATNRRDQKDGKIDSNRRNELIEAAQFDSVEIVEIELSDTIGHEHVINEIREQETETIVSYYNPTETPSVRDLTNIVERCSDIGDIVRVSVFAETRSDALNLLKVVDDADRNGINVIGVSTGEIGRHTRIVAPFYGSKIGFAPIHVENDNDTSRQIELEKLASLLEDVDRGTEHVELMDVLKDKIPSTSASK